MARLLLVDDSAELALVVKRLSRLAGHELLHFPEAVSAWRFLVDRTAAQQCTPPPDLLLLDQHLPGPSGLVLCRRLKASRALRSIRVALFTAPDRVADLSAGLAAGVDFVLSKDLVARPDAWRARIDEFLLPPDGRTALVSLRWLGPVGSTPLQRIEALNRAMSLPCVRQLGTELRQALVERALSALPHSPTLPAEGCFSPGGLSLNAEVLTRIVGVHALPEFAVGLATGLWQVLDLAPLGSVHPQ